ncbi:hypothetical protein SOPP22_02690 [Shewanella sp. OPT22]|nr:hypothetical protein SOPP22_02690 [Shewanella sp. OPT22]
MLRNFIWLIVTGLSFSGFAKDRIPREPSNDMSMLPELPTQIMDDPDALTYYLSLRPRFGSLDWSDQAWKWDDSSSRTGVKLKYTFIEEVRLVAHGDVRPTVKSDYEFGSRRKAYVGLAGHWGQLTYGRQNAAQYNLIAEPVDIFNRLASPLGYDIISPARVNSMVSYQLQSGDWNWQIDKRIHNQPWHSRNRYLGFGGRYHWQNMYFSAAYYQEEFELDTQQVIGLSLSQQITEKLYWATSFQHTRFNQNNGFTADVAMSYQLTTAHKLKFGVSQFKPDSDRHRKQQLVNTTFEWFQTDKLKWFVESQLIKKESATTYQVFMGLRFDFEIKHYRRNSL